MSKVLHFPHEIVKNYETGGVKSKKTKEEEEEKGEEKEEARVIRKG